MTNSVTAPLNRAVLIVDDEPGIRTALCAHFAREGWQAAAAGTLREAEYRLAQHEFDLLVSDVRLPDGSGTALLRTMRETAHPVPAIFLTAYATVPDAVEAMRSGASDYLIKPVAWPQLRTLAGRLLEQTPSGSAPAEHTGAPHPSSFAGDPLLKTPGRAPQAEEAESHACVGNSEAWLAVLARARAAAGTDADILIEGESGTGKKHLARFLHKASVRAHKPLTVVCCRNMPAPLLEETLFDRLRVPEGGTLLLDGVDALPFSMQEKLLDALQDGQRGGTGERHGQPPRLPRVIATTAPGLPEGVADGSFRADLYHRLRVIPIALPTLRERMDDLPLLAAVFAGRWAARTGQTVPALSPDLMKRLRTRSWPGNVRDLADTLEQIFSEHAPSASASRDCFAPEKTGDSRRPEPTPLAPGLPIRQLERLHLEKTLALTAGNRTRAAELLGISLRTVRNKIREYGLPPRTYAQDHA